MKNIGISGVALTAILLITALDSHAVAPTTICTNGAAASILDANCTVSTSLIPTTVNFTTGTAGNLILNGASPTGVVDSQDGTETGITEVTGSTSTQNTFGKVGVPNYKIRVNDGVTFNVAHDLNMKYLQIGQGSSGLLNHSSGTIQNQAAYLDRSLMHLYNGAVYNQTGDAVFNGVLKFIDNATVYIKNQGTLTIDPYYLGNPKGSLIFTDTFDTNWNLGDSGTYLRLIRVNDGANLTLDKAAATLDFVVGEGNSGVLTVPNANTTIEGHFTLNANATLQTTVTGSNQNDSGSLVIKDTYELYSPEPANITISPDAILDVNVANGVSLIEGTTYILVDGQNTGANNISIAGNIIDYVPHVTAVAGLTAFI